MKINIIKKNKFNLFFVFLALFYLFCFEILNCRKNEADESKFAKSLIPKQLAYKPGQSQINFNNKKKKKGSRSLYHPKKSNDVMGGNKKTQNKKPGTQSAIQGQAQGKKSQIKKSGTQSAIQGQSQGKKKSQIKNFGLKKTDKNKKKRSNSVIVSGSSGSSSGSGSPLSLTIDKAQIDNLEQSQKNLEEDKKKTESEINKLKEEEEKNKKIADDKKKAFEELIKIKKEIEKNPKNEQIVKDLQKQQEKIIVQAQKKLVDPRSINLNEHKGKDAYDPVFTAMGNLSAAELIKLIEENEKYEKNQALIRDKKIKELNENAQKISLQIDDNKQKQITQDNIFMETIQQKDQRKEYFEIYLNNNNENSNKLKVLFKNKTAQSFIFNTSQNKFHQINGFLVEENALLIDLSDALKKDDTLNSLINSFIGDKNACFVGFKNNKFAVLIKKENGFNKFAVAAGLIKDDNLNNQQLQEQKQINQQNKLQIYDDKYDKDLSSDQKRLKEECLKYYNEQYDKKEEDNLIIYGLSELNKKLKIKQQENIYTKGKKYVQPCYFESMLPLAIIDKQCKSKQYVDKIVDFFINSNLSNFILSGEQLDFYLIIKHPFFNDFLLNKSDLIFSKQLLERRKEFTLNDSSNFISFEDLKNQIEKTIKTTQSIILKSAGSGHYTLNIYGSLIPDSRSIKQKTLDYYKENDRGRYNFNILPILSCEEIYKILNFEYNLENYYVSSVDAKKNCLFIGGNDKIPEAMKLQEQNREKQKKLMELIIEEEKKQVGGGGQKNLQQQQNKQNNFQQQQQQQKQEDDKNITIEQIMKQEPLNELYGKKIKDYAFLFKDNGKYLEEEYKSYGEFYCEENFSFINPKPIVFTKDTSNLLNMFKYIDHKGMCGGKLVYFAGPDGKYYYARTNQFCLNDKFEQMYEDYKKNPGKYNNNVAYVLNQRAKRHCGEKTDKDYFARMKKAIMLKIIADQKKFAAIIPKPKERPGNACLINAIGAALILFKQPRTEDEYSKIEEKVLNSDLFKISIPDEGIDLSFFKLKNDPQNEFFNFCNTISRNQTIYNKQFKADEVHLIKGPSHFSIVVGNYDNGCYIDSNSHTLSDSSFKNLSNSNEYLDWKLDLGKVELFLSDIEKYPDRDTDFLEASEQEVIKSSQNSFAIFLGRAEQ
jgi:hypothetical protein